MKRLCASAAIVAIAAIGFASPALAGNNQGQNGNRQGQNQGEFPAAVTAACASIGGDIGRDNQTPGGNFTRVLWTCNDWPVSSFADIQAALNTLAAVCPFTTVVDVKNHTIPGTGVATCGV